MITEKIEQRLVSLIMALISMIGMTLVLSSCSESQNEMYSRQKANSYISYAKEGMNICRGLGFATGSSEYHNCTKEFMMMKNKSYDTNYSTQATMYNM